MSVPTTFLCPHCGAQYPVKPVLVGKVVRCTTCKNPFRLRPDGVADKVEVGTTSVPKTAAAPAAPATVSAPTPAAAPVSTQALAAAPAAAPGPSPLRPPTDPPASTATRRLAAAKPQLTQQQLDARKAMAESLSAAAGEALKAAEPSEESSAKGGSRKTDAKRTSSFLKPPSDPKKAGKGPAILTGEGEREAAITRMWWLVFAGLIVLVGVVAFIATRTGSRTAAIDAFAAEVAPADNRFGRRMEAIQARAWSPEVTAFVSLPSPTIGSEHTIPAAALGEALGKLAGLTYVAAADRWISPDKVEWLKRQVAEDPKNAVQRLERSGVVNVDNKVVTQALRSANLSDEELEIVHDLLLTTGPLAGKLAKGPAPAIRWCAVHGRNGTVLFNPGGGYKTRVDDYTGRLVAFTGEGWPSDWRFLTLEAVQKTPASVEK